MTLTVSPPRSGLSSTKLAPLPSECGRSVPVWVPDREPLTVTLPSCAGGAPRRLIWVSGEADWTPGMGNAPTVADVVCAPAPQAIRPHADDRSH